MNSVKSRIVCAVLGLGLAGGTAFGLDRRDSGRDRDRDSARSSGGGRQVVEDALKRQYPNGTFTIRDSQPQANGVTVYEADVRTPQGSTYAKLTDKGEFMTIGQPARLEDAPVAVREAVGLLKNADNVDQFLGVYYYVYIGSGEPYQLRFNPAGKLLEVRSPRALSAENPARLERAPESEHARLGKAAESRFARASVGNMFRSGDAANQYIVEVTSEGKRGFVMLDDRLMVLSQRIGIEPSQLPEAVRRTVSDMFRSEIRSAEKSEQAYWQVRQRGADSLAMKVKGNGDVMDVYMDEPRSDDRAVPAGGRDDRRMDDRHSDDRRSDDLRGDDRRSDDRRSDDRRSDDRRRDDDRRTDDLDRLRSLDRR